MTNPIGRRLDRLEDEIERMTDPGYGPVFRLIDDPSDPENEKRWKEAKEFRRENPNGLITHHIVLSPPNGELNWERYHESGASAQIAEAQSSARQALLSKMLQRIDAECAEPPKLS